MTTRSTSSSWVMSPPCDPWARLRLFCVPYAGGGAIMFRSWASSLAPEVAVCPIQLPGRESRMREAPFTRVGPLVQTLADVLQPYLDRPFAFFGHSMGALVAFELARELRRQAGLAPVHLFVSARSAPQLPGPATPLYRLPENAFVEQLRRIGGTPEAVLQNADLMQLLLPLLRADFAINEAYEYTAEEPLACPITAFAGLQDSKVSPDAVRPWAVQTSSCFTLGLVPGNHFFVNDAQALLPAIARDLGKHLGETSIVDPTGA